MDFTKFTSGLTDVYLEEYLAVSEKFDKFFFVIMILKLHHLVKSPKMKLKTMHKQIYIERV